MDKQAINLTEHEVENVVRAVVDGNTTFTEEQVGDLILWIKVKMLEGTIAKMVLDGKLAVIINEGQYSFRKIGDV